MQGGERNGAGGVYRFKSGPWLPKPSRAKPTKVNPPEPDPNFIGLLRAAEAALEAIEPDEQGKHQIGLAQAALANLHTLAQRQAQGAREAGERQEREMQDLAAMEAAARAREKQGAGIAAAIAGFAVMAFIRGAVGDVDPVAALVGTAAAIGVFYFVIRCTHVERPLS